MLIGIARQKSVSVYAGAGVNRWPAMHRLDAARLYRLAVEKGAAEPRYHAVADEGVPFRDIAAVIGYRLDVSVGSPISRRSTVHRQARTRELLGWQPAQPGLIADLDRPRYFET